jgi:hypothetical protein
MSYTLEFTIADLPKIISNTRGHWSVLYRESRKWRKLVAQALGANVPKLPLKVAQCEFLRASSVEPDYDNCVSSFKHCTDALVEWGVLENDRPSNMPGAKYTWQKAKPGAGFIRVKVQEVTP